MNGPCVYELKNIVTGRKYIGSTKEPLKRKKFHLSRLLSKNHPNKDLQCSFNKHGKDFFEFNIISYVAEENMRCVEKQLILLSENSYNKNIPPENMPRKRVVPETQKITHTEIKDAIDTYYFVFKTKDALAKAADFVGVSISTIRK